MSGDGTFPGTNFQAKVIAFIYGHVLSQGRLNWLPREDDTPVSVWGDPPGPGGDIRIEFGNRLPPTEVQAKLNLTAGQRLKEAAREIIGRSSPERRMRVILAVNSNASKAVRIDVARDLERLRSGRRDGLHDETQDLLTVKGSRRCWTRSTSSHSTLSTSQVGIPRPCTRSWNRFLKSERRCLQPSAPLARRNSYPEHRSP